MGGTIFSKFLIPFSVDGKGCVPSLLLDLRPNYGGGNEDNGNLLQKSHAQTLLHSMPLTLQQATANLHLHQSMRLLDTHGHVWVSLLWGHCSFHLGPGVHKVWLVPSKSLFKFCVSSGSPMVGLMATSSKRAYAMPRSAAPETLPLWQATADPYLHRRHSDTVLADIPIWMQSSKE